jgi:hypothetical protein
MKPIACQVTAPEETAEESSSALFQRLMPKFLDWQPPTEEEKALEVKARHDAREAELKRVMALQKLKDAKKSSARKRR